MNEKIEIEITPEMIEAGRLVFDTFWAQGGPDEASVEEMLSGAFASMIRASVDKGS